MAVDVMVMEKKALLQDCCACRLPVQVNYSSLNYECLQLVWDVEQSWTEATELSNFTRGKIDLQQCLSSAVMLSTEHLEIYKDKLVDARGLSHHRNKTQSQALSKRHDGQTDRQTAFQLYH